MSPKLTRTAVVTCPARRISALAAVAVALLSHAAVAQTAFTYQGRLKASGAPVTTACDFKFSLWDAATGGSQVGPTLTFDGAGGNPPSITPASGLLYVQLDFGTSPNPMDGSPRWLKIEMRNPAGSGAYAALDPRQPLTATPYATYARSAPPSGPAGGDLAGTYPNPTVARLQGRPVDSAAPNSGQVLKWDGAQWTPGPGGGFDLRYVRTYTTPFTALPLFDITDSMGAGGGGVASFKIDQQDNPSVALKVESAGQGDVISGKSTGAGRAGRFEIDSGNNGQAAVEAKTNGAGVAVLANSTGTNSALDASINSPNGNNPSPAVIAVTNGTGEAVQARINKANSASDAVWGMTSGTGSGVRGNSAGGSGVSGTSTNSTGVFGQSTNDNGMLGIQAAASAINGPLAGVRGDSNAGAGVVGTSSSDSGVQGVYGGPSGINLPNNGHAGVWGDSNAAAGIGVAGTSVNREGVYGRSSNDNGVRGVSVGPSGIVLPSIAGVLGESSPKLGVAGASELNTGVLGLHGVASQLLLPLNAPAGVLGAAKDAYGVAGISDHNPGVYGKSVTGFAGQFEITDPGNINPSLVGSNTAAGPGISGFGATMNGVQGLTHGPSGLPAESSHVTAGVFGSGQIGVAGIGASEDAFTPGHGVYALGSGPGHGVLAISGTPPTGLPVSLAGVLGMTREIGGGTSSTPWPPYFLSPQPEKGMIGVLGQAYDRVGVWGESITKTAVVGTCGARAGLTEVPSSMGVYGRASQTAGTGVFGLATAAMGMSHGVLGTSASSGDDFEGIPGGVGVYGYATGATGSTRGVQGFAVSVDGSGVFGTATGSGTFARGVQGYTYSADGNGVFGYNYGTSGGAGVVGASASISGIGVYGVAGPPPSGMGSGAGVFGSSGGGEYGVYGLGALGSVAGVYGAGSVGGYGVYSSGDAYVDGDLDVTGFVFASAKLFKMDHPLDPANKYLNHGCVESPEMKNIYDGITTLDASGQAWVQLPDYFEALNQDFRYQLTAVGAPGPNLFVATEVRDNKFQIAGGRPGAKVSWQITGIRHDAMARAHPVRVEQDKPAAAHGKYMNPVEHGQPESLGINYERRSRARSQMLAQPAHAMPDLQSLTPSDPSRAASE